jgi:hypothetical protein
MPKYKVKLTEDSDAEFSLFVALTPNEAAEMFCRDLDSRVLQWPPERNVTVIRDGASFRFLYVVELRSEPVYRAKTKR